MRRPLVNRTLVAVIALVVVVAAAIAAVPLLVNTRAVQTWVAQSASQTLGRRVRFTSVSIQALPLPTLRLKNLEVAEDPAFGAGPFLTVKEGRLGIRLRPLLSRRLELADLTLHDVRVSLVEDARGRINIATIGTPAAAAPAPAQRGTGRAGAPAVAAVLLSRVTVVNGAVDYRGAGDRPSLRLEQVNVTARQEAAGQPIRVEGDGRSEPGGVRFRIRDATLAPAASHVVGDTDVSATVDVNVPELSSVTESLFGYTGAGGRLTGSIEVTGRPAHLGGAGVLTSPRIAITSRLSSCRDRASRPLALDAVRIPLRGEGARLDTVRAEAAVAGGTVSLDATLRWAPRALVQLSNIAVRRVELEPVLVEHFCQPYGVTGRLDLDADAQVELTGNWQSTRGSGRFRIGSGKVVGTEVVNLVREVAGLGVMHAAFEGERAAARSALDFDSITGSYTIANGVARTDDLVYRARDVTVRAAGTYALADRRVAVEVTLSERGNRVAGFVSGAPGSLRVVPLAVRLQDARDVRAFLDRLFR